MTLPANIRVNLSVPFPAMVRGSGFTTVVKGNGVWFIGASADLLGAQTPGASPTDYVLVWDSVAKGWFKVSLSNLLTTAAVARTQRSVSATPIVVSGTDQIINVNVSSAASSCTLPQASSRAGVALTFKDAGTNFGLFPLTITPFAGDTIDGASKLVLNANRQGVTLVPFNDGVNVGWAIE